MLSYLFARLCHLLPGQQINVQLKLPLLYFQNFRDQLIDGSGLPLLTEEHLTSTMNMKLGPALKLRSILAKKLGSCSVCLHCSHCHSAAVAGSPEPGNNAGSTSDSGGTSWGKDAAADGDKAQISHRVPAILVFCTKRRVFVVPIFFC